MKGFTVEDLQAKGLNVREQTIRTVATPGDVVTLSLPLPPSVNMAWMNVVGKGRVRTPEYRRWHKLAFDELSLQRPAKIRGKFAAVIEIGRLKRRCDLDNRVKPLLDLLSGVAIDDDAFCERLSVGWSDTVPAERVVVIVRRAE